MIRGSNFPVDGEVVVTVGSYPCGAVSIVSEHEVRCRLGAGHGENLDVSLAITTSVLQLSQKLPRAVSYSMQATPRVDVKEAFSDFLALGVGGLDRQLRELYRRAFQSRELSQDVLQGLGIQHAKV